LYLTHICSHASLIVALGSAGCSHEDVLETRHIRFDAYMGKQVKAPSTKALSTKAPSTKAAQTDLTNDNFTTFNVTALGNNATYFDDQTFTKATNYDSEATFFWPTYDLIFCAYNVPATTTGFVKSISYGESSQSIKVTPAAELANQEDLVASYQVVKESETPATGVCALTFNHYLTEVIIKAKISNAQYSVAVEGVKIANMSGEGTYTFKNNSTVATSGTVNTSTSKDYSATFTAKTLTTEAQEVMTNAGTGRWYLIPQAVKPWKQATEATNASHGTYLALKVKMTTNNGTCKVFPFNGDNAAWMAVPLPTNEGKETFDFAQGKKYTIILNFFGAEGAGFVDPEVTPALEPGAGNAIVKQGKKISFSSTITDWDAVTVEVNL